ncbi:MAG: hypothetical protein ABJ242_11565 [Marinomonas sp.]
MSRAIWASPRWRTALLVLTSTPLLASCAVYSEPTIQDSIGNAAGLREVAILSSKEDAGLRIDFRKQLQLAFRARGVPSKDTADVIGDFAISTMHKDMSLASSRSGGENGVVIQSAPRKSKFLDRCEDVRYRATLVLFNRTSGERVHRAEGESQGCKGDPAPLDDLADTLVRDALLAPL